MTRHLLMLTVTFSALLFGTVALAQSGQFTNTLDLTGFVITNGGGTSTGEDAENPTHKRIYSVSDGIGQSVIDEQSNGSYTLYNGLSASASTVDNLVLLYLNGDNDLTDYILEAAQQAQAGARITTTVTVVMMVLDGPAFGDSYLYRLDHKGATECNLYNDYTCGGRYLLGYNVWKFDENLGVPATLTKFVVGSIQGLPGNGWDGMPSYPSAKRIILSLVGHGGGWNPNLLAGQPKGHVTQAGLGGLAWDDNAEGFGKGTSISTIELGIALNKVKAQTNRQIDLLYLDACLMAMWEVVVEIQDSTRYLLASESWTWTAFAYDKLLQELNKPIATTDLGEVWIHHKADEVGTYHYPLTYSMVDLAQTDAISQSLNSLSSELIDLLPSEHDAIYSAFVASDCFDSDEDFRLDHGTATEDGDAYCDLLSFVAQLKDKLASYPEVVTASQVVENAIKLAVVKESHDNGRLPPQYGSFNWSWQQLGGFSIFLPLNEKDDWKRAYYGQLLWSKGEKGWDEFINKYRLNADYPSAPSCPEPCDLPAGYLVIQQEWHVYLPVISR